MNDDESTRGSSVGKLLRFKHINGFCCHSTSSSLWGESLTTFLLNEIAHILFLYGISSFLKTKYDFEFTALNA